VGSLTTLAHGRVYVDANILIYTIERVVPYVHMLDPLWQELASQRAQAITSEIVVLETLVGPMRTGNTALEALFRRVLFRSPNLSLIPITMSILEHAAHLRAQTQGLKTPDAIHAAAALEAGVNTFITNDMAFRQIPGLNVLTPRDLPTP